MTNHRTYVQEMRKLFAIAMVMALSIAVLPSAASADERSNTVADVAAAIGADNLVAAGFDGSGIDVAVIDTGVEPVQGLHGEDKLLLGPDLSFEAGVPEFEGHDTYGHGTVMASVIAGNDGPDGFQGVAPGARIVSVKVADNTGAVDVTQVIAALDWVVEFGQQDGLNVRVINLSYVTDSDQPYEIDPLAAAVERAWKAGYVVVVAAGNAGDETETLGNPAADPYVIAVAASDGPSAALFSNQGSKDRAPDVLAPGHRILGLAAPQSRLVQENASAFIDGTYLRGSGTSQAAAVVSGAAALLLDQRPELTPDQVKAMLIVGTVGDDGRGSAKKLSPFKAYGEYFDLLDLEAEMRAEAEAFRSEADRLRAAGDTKGAEDADKDADKADHDADKHRAKAEQALGSDFDKYRTEAKANRAEANELRGEAADLRVQADATWSDVATWSMRSGKFAEEQVKDLTKVAEDLTKVAEDLEKDAAKLDEDAAKADETAAKAVETLTEDIEKVFRDWDGNNLGGIKYDRHDGSGTIDIERSAALPTFAAVQTHQPSNASGSLEAARGSNHVTLPDGSLLRGEVDFSGNSWSGNSWSGNSWSGNSWSGNSWSGNSWSGNSWSGNSWSGNSWSGNSWSGNSWSGNSWSGNSWSGNTWSGSEWS